MTNFPEPANDFFPSEECSSGIEIHNPSGHPLPFDKDSVSKVITSVENGENIQLHHVELVFTDEDGIVEINNKYLQRNYVTDIISFRYDDGDDQKIEGTLYCCAPRIVEQSKEFETTGRQEFFRIIIHGLLHLAGYDDQADTEKQKMTEREDYYLQSLES